MDRDKAHHDDTAQKSPSGLALVTLALPNLYTAYPYLLWSRHTSSTYLKLHRAGLPQAVSQNIQKARFVSFVIHPESAPQPSNASAINTHADPLSQPKRAGNTNPNKLNKDLQKSKPLNAISLLSRAQSRRPSSLELTPGGVNSKERTSLYPIEQNTQFRRPPTAPGYCPGNTTQTRKRPID